MPWRIPELPQGLICRRREIKVVVDPAIRGARSLSNRAWPLHSVAVALSITLLGCASQLPTRHDANLPAVAELLSGKALFGEAVSAMELPDADVRGVDDEMRAFVSQAVDGIHSHEARLERLLRAMLGSGLFSLDYQGEMTLTASETFHSGVGNCLAFTNLFVALAREARLRVNYQQVLVPAMWTGDGDTAILNQHVNVLVRDTTDGRFPPRNQVVDFNLPSYRGNFPQRPITDTHVDALFYNNLGANAIRSGEQRDAFVYLLKAIHADDGVAATWTNLGVLYQRNDRLDHAESAYRQALRVDSRHKPAMSNLARLYARQGIHALADEYRERIRQHQQRNPYYHLWLAQQAYDEGRPDFALASVDRAIRLRRDEHRFHYMRAMILTQIGQHDASRASLERAREYASVAQVQEIYDRKLSKFQ
jgi:Flp pilus assembly protein TadD